MKKLLLFVVVGIVFFGLTALAWAQDNGTPDTLYVECYDSVKHYPPPWEVHFPLLITNDISNPVIDSIAGMIIALCFTSSNPAANAQIEGIHNNTDLYPFPNLNNSIFRHLPSMQNPQIYNFMMNLAEQEMGLEWDCRILDHGGGTHFWMSLIPTGTEDQRFPGGSRVLTAIATITLEDTTTICIDTCSWPISGRPIDFSRSDAITYIPQDNLPYCVEIQYSPRGDATGDSVVNVADVMYMINYLFKSGPPPVSFEAGDANCDSDHGILDIVFLVNYLYKKGPAPGC